MAIQTVDFSNITRVVKDGSEINAIYINGSQLFLKADISTDDVNFTWDDYESFAGFLTTDNFGSNHSGDSYWIITERVHSTSASHIEMSEDLLTMVLIASRYPTTLTTGDPSSYGVVVYTRSSVESVTWDYNFSIETDTDVGRQAHITSDGGYLALFRYGVAPTPQGQIDVYKWDGATYVAHGVPIDTGESVSNQSAFAILDDGEMVVFGSEEGVESRIFFDGQWLVGAPIASLVDWRMTNLKLRQGSRDLPTQPFGCLLMVIESTTISVYEYTSNGWSQQPYDPDGFDDFNFQIRSVAWSGDGHTVALNYTTVVNTSDGITVSRRFRIWRYIGGSWVRDVLPYAEGTQAYNDSYQAQQGHVFETETYCRLSFRNRIASNSVCLNYDGTRMAYIATNDWKRDGGTGFRSIRQSVVGYVYENGQWRPNLGQIGDLSIFEKADLYEYLPNSEKVIHNLSMSNAGDQIVVSRLSQSSYDISLFDAEPKYVLSPISGGLVYEGYPTSILLTTTGVLSGTEVAYTITGVEAADLQEPLTGVLTVLSNTATLQLNVVADNLTEGTQVMTISLDNGQSSLDITIADSSTGP